MTKSDTAVKNCRLRTSRFYHDPLDPTRIAPQARRLHTLRSASAAYENGQTDFLNLIDNQNSALDVES